MRPPRRDKARHRRGNILAIAIVMMPVILGFAGLSADLGVIALARSQLMTVADSAALAGAQQLASASRVIPGYVPTTEMAAARTSAQTIGQSNYVLNTHAVVDKNNDVSITEFDLNSGKWAVASSPVSSKYNTVTVNAQRSSGHGGVVPAFFSVIWGSQGTSAAFSSTATAENYSISGHKVVGTENAPILPIAMNSGNYNQMLLGQTSDQYTYTPPSSGNPNGTVSAGSDGVYESQVFPVSTNSGNWGTVKIGVSNNSTKTLGDQIDNGITPAQLANVPGGFLLNPANNPPSFQLGGNPGISAGIKDDLSSIIGRPVSVPLYDQVTGNGNNTSYRIVGFGAVRIVAVNFQGSNKYVIVQPASIIGDPTAIPGVPQSWTSGGVVNFHLTR